MKTRLTRLLHVALSFCLAFVLLLTVLPMQGLAATEATVEETDISALTLENIPEILKQELNIVDDSSAALGINTYGLRDNVVIKSGLLASDAQRLDGLTIVNPDGTKTAYSFGADIKFIEDNAVKFIDNEIINKISITDGKLFFYQTKQSDSKLYLPLNISNGLLFTNGDLKLTLAPAAISFGAAELKILDGNEYAVQYDNVFAKGISLQYLSVYGGFKENIIINEKNGISEFSYILNIPGYKAELTDGGKTVTVYNKENSEESYVFGKPFAQDANGKLTDECNYKLTHVFGDRYILTLCADKDFLNDADTAYPVTVDPPLEVSRGSVEDATVSSAGTIDTTSSIITVGIDENGNDNAAFVRCNFLWYFRHLRPDDITSASFLTAPVSGNSSSGTILSLYDSIWMFGFEKLTFDKVERCQYEIQSSVMFSPVNTTCNFNITELMQRWLRSYLAEPNWKSPEYGFFIRNTTDAVNLFSAESSHSFYPCFSITYDEEPAIADGYYYIKNNQYDKYLSYSDDDMNVFIDEFSLYKDDVYTLRWYIGKVTETAYGEVFYRILPDKYSENEALGTNINDPYINDNNIQLNNIGSSSDLWRIIQNADGTFRFMPAFSTMQSLTADNTGEYNAYTYEYHGWDSMRWELEALTTGVTTATPILNELLGEGAPDCFGYALGSSDEVNMNMDSDDTIDFMKQMAIATAFDNGILIYEIEDYNSPIRDDEYRICMRIGNPETITFIFNEEEKTINNTGCDYHFMKQVIDPTDNLVKWAEKRAALAMDRARDIHAGNNPEGYTWTICLTITYRKKEYVVETTSEFYNSDTVFFAVRMDG